MKQVKHGIWKTILYIKQMYYYYLWLCWVSMLYGMQLFVCLQLWKNPIHVFDLYITVYLRCKYTMFLDARSRRNTLRSAFYMCKQKIYLMIYLINSFQL